MKVFITGGSGFLGQRIIYRLLREGHEVIGLARSESSEEIIRIAGAVAVRGDMRFVDTLSFNQVDVVVHAAAPVVFWGAWDMYEREIVQASLALYRRAAAQGVKRFIYISSESVMQNGLPLLDIDESQPFANPPNSDYGRAKKEAEIALQAAMQDSPECELVILRSTFIWSADAPALQVMAAKVKSGQFSWIDGGTAAFEAVHVNNVAQAVEKALSRGTSGSVYLITDGRAYTVREFLTPLISRSAGKPLPNRSVPHWLVYPVARLLETVWRTAGKWESSPPLTRFEVAFMSQPRRYRIDAAIRELGYQPVSFEA